VTANLVGTVPCDHTDEQPSGNRNEHGDGSEVMRIRLHERRTGTAEVRQMRDEADEHEQHFCDRRRRDADDCGKRAEQEQALGIGREVAESNLSRISHERLSYRNGKAPRNDVSGAFVPAFID
jgi:hypothetical protein